MIKLVYTPYHKQYKIWRVAGQISLSFIMAIVWSNLRVRKLRLPHRFYLHLSTCLFVSLPVLCLCLAGVGMARFPWGWERGGEGGGGSSVSSWPNHLVFFAPEIRLFPLKSRPFRLADPVFSTMRIRFRRPSPASRLPISSVGKATGPSNVHWSPASGSFHVSGPCLGSTSGPHDSRQPDPRRGADRNKAAAQSRLAREMPARQPRARVPPSLPHNWQFFPIVSRTKTTVETNLLH